MRYLIATLIFSSISSVASANSIIYVVNSGAVDSVRTGQTMMQLSDDGSTEVLLKDLQMNHLLIRQLINELVMRAQAAFAAQNNNNSTNNTTDTSQPVYRPENLEAALRYALIAGGWEVCTVCPGAITPGAKSTSPARQVSAPSAGGSTAGGSSNGNSSNGGGSNNSNPGLNSAQNVAQLDTANASIAAVTNTSSVVGPGAPVALGSFGDGGPSFGSELAPNTGDPGVIGPLADVPEPGTWAMVGAGLMLAIVRLRKSRLVRDPR